MHMKKVKNEITANERMNEWMSEWVIEWLSKCYIDRNA